MLTSIFISLEIIRKFWFRDVSWDTEIGHWLKMG